MLTLKLQYCSACRLNAIEYSANGDKNPVDPIKREMLKVVSQLVNTAGKDRHFQDPSMILSPKFLALKPEEKSNIFSPELFGLFKGRKLISYSVIIIKMVN